MIKRNAFAGFCLLVAAIVSYHTLHGMFRETEKGKQQRIEQEAAKKVKHKTDQMIPFLKDHGKYLEEANFTTPYKIYDKDVAINDALVMTYKEIITTLLDN